MASMKETSPSVRLQISETPGGGATIKLSDNWGSTLFEPQREPTDPHPSTGSYPDPGPEKKLTLFALRLAVLEKAATGLGTLGFIWATVVLLGGFAITLQTKDFWFITVILLIEGTRIFSRSHELEWQHQATWSLTEAGIYSFRLLQSTSRRFLRAFRLASTDQPNNSHSDVPVRTRTWQPDAVPILPCTSWVFLSRNISRMLYWLQLLSASACVSLSMTRLLAQDYGAVDEAGKRNRRSALNIFYGLAFAEALIFLAERGFWEWKVSYSRLLDEVSRECDLGPSGLLSIRRFFYDAYSCCVNGSIFDGLKIDLVSFAEELLISSSRDEQLIGIRILLKSSTSRRFADETLRKLGTSTPVIERLIEMLNWKNPAEEEIRRSAATIISKLAGKKQNALRLAGIPGAMESISSLLHPNYNQSSKEISHFNLLGLSILKKLANDHNYCSKIGNTRGLLIRIIDFTGGAAANLCDSATEMQIKSVKHSLELLKMLSSTSFNGGEALRQEIMGIIFAISNIRDILQHSDKNMAIQKLAIEILTSLAMGDDARERIGCTGGVINELLRILFRPGTATDPARAEAGEALAMLALESEANCRRIIKPAGVVAKLIEGIEIPPIRINCCRILRNLCCYSSDGARFGCLRMATAAYPTVLKGIMTGEMKMLEVSMGLAARIMRMMNAEDVYEEMERLGVSERRVAERLVQVLRKYGRPSIKVPRMRRFAMEMAIEMMREERCAGILREVGMGEELERVEETTEELEEFLVFLGSVGVSRHRTSICELVETAKKLIDDGCD